MPYRCGTVCKHRWCNQIVRNGQMYCAEHAPLHSNDRASAKDRGYDSRWAKARASFLKRNCFCVKCMADGKYVEATVVDHIVPHRGDKTLFWTESNWQALCKKCHDRKTWNEDAHPTYTYRF